MIVIMLHNLYLYKNKWTPLHLAASSGHIQVVETLIRLGADINVVQKVSLYIKMSVYLAS